MTMRCGRAAVPQCSNRQSPWSAWSASSLKNRRADMLGIHAGTLSNSVNKDRAQRGEHDGRPERDARESICMRVATVD